MLSVNTYSKKDVDDVRRKLDTQVAAFGALAKAARKAAGSDKGPVDTALGTFETVYFNGLVLILEGYFVHRMRGKEGKDGNPMNEVRLLANSLMSNDGIFATEKSITWKPEASVLGYKPGDPIQLSEADFVQLAEAFYASLQAKYR